jgi:L-lactate utilization protein LutB
LDTQSKPDLERSLSRQFAVVADDARVARTATALEANGISVVRAANAGEAKRIVLELVPAGAQVHNGASQSLEETGIAEEIHNSGRYEPIHPRIWSMTGRRRPTRSAG